MRVGGSISHRGLPPMDSSGREGLLQTYLMELDESTS
jgi:hypothetical protein